MHIARLSMVKIVRSIMPLPSLSQLLSPLLFAAGALALFFPATSQPAESSGLTHREAVEGARVGQVRLGQPESAQRFELPRDDRKSAPEAAPSATSAPSVPVAPELQPPIAAETARGPAQAESNAQANEERFPLPEGAAFTSSADTGILTPEGYLLELPRLEPKLEASQPGAVAEPIPQPQASERQSEPTESPALPVAEAPPAPLLPAYTDLWSRMRSRFALPTLQSALVQQHIRGYTSRPESLERMFDRGGRYLFYIVEEIERRDMPGELALLPFVESAMNPTAISPAKAAGLWQFIPSTGKAFNLSQNWWVDNRRDPVHSTHAALDYLQRIYEMHGSDWFLALASYNRGEGAVGRAIRRNQAAGKPGDYLALNMPQETRNYVPKLMALRDIVADPERYGIKLPTLANKPYFVAVEAPMHLDLKLAARFAGMSEEEFVHLNPAHNRPVIAARANDQLKIPADRVDRFLASMRAHEEARKPFSTWRPHTLEPQETLHSLASHTGTTVQELMRANGLRSAKVLPGTRILAPASEDRLVQSVTAMTTFDGPRILEKVQQPAMFHRVERRETMESIARRYGITVASLRTWNNVKAGVRQGMRLLVKPASAQTLLTTESGVPKVIATEVQPPKANPPAASPVRIAAPSAAQPAAPSSLNRSAAKAKASGTPTASASPSKPSASAAKEAKASRKSAASGEPEAPKAQKSSSRSSGESARAKSAASSELRPRPLGPTI